jgi:hypothetical protein
VSDYCKFHEQDEDDYVAFVHVHVMNTLQVLFRDSSH